MQRRQSCIVLVTAALCCATLEGRAFAQQQPQLLVFKDGFTLQGRIKMEKSYMSDAATGAVFTVPTQGKPSWMDDGVRSIFFSPMQLADAWKDDVKPAEAPLKFDLTGYAGKDPLPLQWEVKSAGKWGSDWQRTLTLTSTTSKKFPRFTVTQRISKITPEVVCITTQYYKWTAYYKTKECNPELLRFLVLEHVKKQDEFKGKPLDQHGMVFKFLMQAGFTDAADNLLDQMLKDFPNDKSKIEPLRDDVKRARARQLVAELERADKAGLHGYVTEQLAQYAKGDYDKVLAEKAQLRVQAIRKKQETTATKLKEATRLLDGFAAIASFGKKEFYKGAAKAILEELGPDNLGRLETFLSQAQDYERALKDNRKPDQTADEVLAFAVTGWARGSEAAERFPEVAARFWELRKALQEALQADAAQRKQLAAWLKGKGLGVDEAMQMIRLLPPPEAPDQLPEKGAKLQAKGVSYHVQLPPGYNPGRPWPVLMVLHHSQEKAAEALERWAELAGRHGYIVVAPQWGTGLKVPYGFTAKEHQAVLEALRDVRRKFQVDSDRVFLFGVESGGQAAFDIAAAHPDQFAGAMPMAARPEWFIPRYWPNAQYLHLYIINGDMAGKDTYDAMRAVCKEWISHHYPAIYVEYKGRPAELFGAEGETLVDWMSHKHRLNPLRELGGKDEEFRMLRPGDNQFYWLAVDGITAAHIAEASSKAFAKVPAAKVSASIFADNSISVKTLGVKEVTIWFGPKMVNYAQPVTVKINGPPGISRTVTPNLETLLDHQAQTGDRQRMYFAGLDFKV